jgi:O-antigen ligase
LYFIFPFALIILSNKIYLGPIIITQIKSLKDDKAQNSIESKKSTSKLQAKEGFSLDSAIQEESKLDSYTVRKNLFINGIKLFMSSPLIGVGPGQFRYLLGKYETKYPIDKNCSPHNYFIEMISQYGVIGLIVFLIPLILFLLKLRKGKWNFLFTLIIFFYYLSSLMPSAFLYLDINWILFTVIVLCFSEDFISFKSLKDVRFS